MRIIYCRSIMTITIMRIVYCHSNFLSNRTIRLPELSFLMTRLLLPFLVDDKQIQPVFRAGVLSAIL